MATNTRIDPLKAQRAAAWIAFQRTYRPSPHDLKDYSSWLRWKEKFDPEIRDLISDKMFAFKQDFEELGGYGEVLSSKDSENHETEHNTGSHGGSAYPVTPTNAGISKTPIQPDDEKKAVSAVEAILKRNSPLVTAPHSPSREDYQKRNSTILLKALRKPPPVVTYQLPNTQMHNDEQFKAVFSKVVSDYASGRLSIVPNQNKNAFLSATAEDIFRQIHAKTAKEYDFKEKNHIYTNPELDPVFTRHKKQQTVAQEAVVKLHNEQLTNRGGKALSQEEESILKTEEQARQNLFFALNFPKKATAYATTDSSLQETVSFLETFVPSEEDGIHPSWEHIDEEESVSQPSDTRNFPLVQRRVFPQQPVIEDSDEQEQSPQQPRLRQPRQQVTKPSRTSHESPLHKKGAKKVEHIAGNALKNTLRQGAKQLTQKVAVATSEVWLPWVVGGIIALLLLLLLIVFIVVLLMLANQADNEAGTKTFPITITKSVNKTEMKNPSELSGIDKNLTYTFTTNYGGEAERLETIEVLPPGLSFVQASGTFRAFDQNDVLIPNPTDQKSLVKKIVWTTGSSTSTASPSGPSTTKTTTTVTAIMYTQAPYSFPLPSGKSDISYTPETITRLNDLGSTIASHQSYLLTKVKDRNAKYIDPFLSVIWAGAIEGTGGSPYSWNCGVYNPGTINQGCAGGFSSGNWQVGPGIQVAQAVNHLVDDFVEIYGSDSAEKVKEVGQKAIDNSTSARGGKITNPATFPAETVASLITKAKSGDVASQQLIAVILMDPQISAIVVAQEIAGDIASGNNWRATMEGWGPYYVSNMQNFSNRMGSLASTYTGVSTGTSSSQTFQQQTYTLIVSVNDDVKDTYIINQAAASVIGAKGGSSNPTTTTASNPNASTFLELIKNQGRNSTVLGSEEEFITAVTKNGGSRFGGNVTSANLRELYVKAIAKKVNPLIILTIWGVEQSFSSQDPMFGCLGFPGGFTEQMSCAVNSIHNHMEAFEAEQKKGNIPYSVTSGGKTCQFSDAFDYAYEKYTPVCLMDDGNDNSRKNFVTIYKELLGVK